MLFRKLLPEAGISCGRMYSQMKSPQRIFYQIIVNPKPNNPKMKVNFPIGKGLLIVLLLLLAAVLTFAQPKVVGYMPSWAGQASAIQYTKLTHINYAFIRPTTKVGLTSADQPAKLQDIVN